VFENRVLRRIFGLERDEVTEGWRKLHDEELHILTIFIYYKGDQTKEDEMGGAFSAHGEDEKCVQNFGWKA
jgi:hypothetical protein